MNRYHAENPPDSEPVEAGRAGRAGRASRAGRLTWFPGTPKMHPPSHKLDTPLVISAAPPAKRRKLDSGSAQPVSRGSAIHPFRLCILDRGDYDRPYGFQVAGSSSEWHFTSVKDLSLRALLQAVRPLSRPRSPVLPTIIGCIVPPNAGNILKARDTTDLIDDQSVANFFALTGYSPLIIVAVIEREYSELSDVSADVVVTRPQEQQHTPGPVGMPPFSPAGGEHTTEEHLRGSGGMGRAPEGVASGATDEAEGLVGPSLTPPGKSRDFKGESRNLAGKSRNLAGESESRDLAGGSASRDRTGESESRDRTGELSHALLGDPSHSSPEEPSQSSTGGLFWASMARFPWRGH